MSELTTHRPLVVVGVDGSERSAAVLRWAVHQARALRGRLRVVLAWRMPELLESVPARIEASMSDAMVDRVEGLLADALAYYDIREGELPVERVVQEDGAVRLLLRHARDADLLVLGSSGGGHDAAKLLGSVTQSCLMQAPCPVVVVPAAVTARTPVGA